MSSPGPARPDEEFVVHTDRAAIHRRHGGILVAHGVIAAAVVAAIVWIGTLGVGASAVLPLVIVLLGQLFQLSLHSFVYGGRVAISEPLTLNHWGFSMNTTSGRMEVPWEAVATVQIRHRLLYRTLVFQLHPAAGPGGPGVETDLSAAFWRKMRRFGGPMLGQQGIRESLAEIQQAVGFFSHGRVPAVG